MKLASSSCRGYQSIGKVIGTRAVGLPASDPSLARPRIADLSAVMTLEPGDILATGTPSGLGVAMKPSSLRKLGDVMRVEIDGIGHIENLVAAEPA